MIDIETIPAALKEREQWVCWRYEDRDGRHPAKVPVVPQTREHASHSDPETWGRFDVAHAVATSGDSFPDIEGVGFVFTDDDPFVGIDLDDCIEDGEPEEWVLDIVDQCDSYAEFSPSGTGIHIILRGSLPDGGKRDDMVEMYDMKRFFTVTGHRLDGAPTEVKSRQTELESIHSEFFADEVTKQTVGNGNEVEHRPTGGTSGADNHCGGSNSGSCKVERTEGTTGLNEVRQVVTEEFDERTWDITEASLAAHATLLLNANQNMGLVIVGNSGAGKTTVLKFFPGSPRIIRSDSATPASFVSADGSLSEDELEENDLLPRVQHKTLVCRDMATWFSGTRDTIREKMSVMAPLMDGEGYTRDTGSHGRRGYTGDYRFNFLGASTPLPARTWKVMGHTGNRFVFHEKKNPSDTEEVVETVFGGSTYDARVDRCQSAVQKLLDDLWQTHGGYSTVEWESSPSSEIKEVFTFLTELVIHARAPINDEGVPQREGAGRIANTLRGLACGRALLDGRTELQLEDAQVCARVALSTMPKERRPVVRALVDPANGGELTAKDVELAASVSRPTAYPRMETLETLGIAECTERVGDDRKPKVVKCRSKFKWPDSLPFPKL